MLERANDEEDQNPLDLLVIYFDKDSRHQFPESNERLEKILKDNNNSDLQIYQGKCEQNKSLILVKHNTEQEQPTKQLLEQIEATLTESVKLMVSNNFYYILQ